MKRNKDAKISEDDLIRDTRKTVLVYGTEEDMSVLK